MAFKMRGWSAGEGTGSAKKFRNTMAPNQEMMGARQSPMMKWEGAVERSEGEINKWVAERKRIKAKYKGTSNPKGYKDDPAYQAVQNKINKAYGADKRHGKTETESKKGKKNTKTTYIPGEKHKIRTVHRDVDSKFGHKVKSETNYEDTPMAESKSKKNKSKKTKSRFKAKEKDERKNYPGDTWTTKVKGYKNKDGEWVASKWKRDFGTEGFFGKSKIKKKAARGEDLDKDNMVKKYKQTGQGGMDVKEKIKHRGKGVEYGSFDWYGKKGSKRKTWDETDGIITKTKQKWDPEAGEYKTYKTKTRKKGGTGIGAKIKEKLKNRKNKKNKKD